MSPRIDTIWRWPRVGAVALTIAALGLGGWYWRLHAEPVPPEINLADADAALVQAIGDTRAAVERAPHSAEAWGRLGMVLYQHRFMLEARVCFVQAEKLDPQQVRWPYFCAQIDLNGDRARAAAALERALAASEHDATVRLQLAELRLEQNALADAQRHFAAVLDDAQPHSAFDEARARLGLARLALTRDELPAALELAQRATRLAPSMKDPHIVLAEIQHRLGNRAAAEREHRILLTLPAVRWANPYLEEAEQLSVEVHPRIELARQMQAQGRTAEAVALLEQTAEAHPQSAPVWTSLGQARLHLAQWPGAQQALERALVLSPGEASVLADLGYALSRQGLLDRAVACYQQAIAQNPQNPENYYQLSYCELRRGKTDAAIAALRTAVRMRPHFALAWRELGQVLAGRGERAEARTCLERAVELAPEDAVARERLAKLRSESD
jgi:Flp pilus assembly protein TadD